MKPRSMLRLSAAFLGAGLVGFLFNFRSEPAETVRTVFTASTLGIGIGLAWWHDRTRCELCNGDGIAPSSRALVESGVLGVVRPCNWCKGTGRRSRS